MRERSDSIFYNVDWFTVIIYFMMITMGWFSIYSADYDEVKSSIFNLHRPESKQLLFCIISVGIAFAILVIDASFFTTTAYILFGIIILMNIAVWKLGAEVKGSHSWFRFGELSLQPAEFAKWATALALAKYISGLGVNGLGPDILSSVLNAIGRTAVFHFIGKIIFRLTGKKINPAFFGGLAIILLPVVIMIILQKETGCALVFAAFILVMYREKIFPAWMLLFGIVSAAAMVLGIKYPQLKLWFILPVIAIAALRFVFFVRKRTVIQALFSILLVGYFSGILVASPKIIDKMPEHQSGRIKSWLGLPVSKEISDRFDYNVKEAMIAIGSGGWFGKGYLQGLQTSSGFVPEKETDFIFCKVGEEWGFVGAAFVILLYTIFIVRLITMAERQRSDFTRVFGYSVALIFFIHLVVNIGMTIGLIPVIGIPLPFFSYGGSSLISFTILLFIFLRLDSQRLLVLR